MPQNEEIQFVRTKYGLNSDSGTDNDYEVKEKMNSKKQELRNYDYERTILLNSLERISKTFLKQLAEGDCVLDNDSRFVEEFCTIIELCMQHGWKSISGGLLKQRDCFWIVLENYGKKNPSIGSNQTAYDIVRNHLSLPNNISKLRAWIRIALTKKILVSELKKSLSIVKKPEQCFYKWSVTRNDTFNSWLNVVESLNKIDFNLLVKESTLNLSEKSIKWSELIDSDGCHLERFAPYLSLDLKEEIKGLDDLDIDKVLLRQLGFLEDENIRLRRSVLHQLNLNSKADTLMDELKNDLNRKTLYVMKLEEEIQRLQKIKYELEEKINAETSKE